MKMKTLCIACIALVPYAGNTQNSQIAPPLIVQSLPSAPAPQPIPNQSAPMAANGHPSSDSPANAGIPLSLSLKQAEALALKNNPQISVARLTALASHQVTREVRSSLWPTATGDLTGVDSKDNSRITAGGLNNPIIYESAGGLNNPIIYERAAAGVW